MSYSIPQPEQPGHSVLAATFEYNEWANLRLLDFCAGLNEEQLAATTVGVYGTMRRTLIHMVAAEVDYVTRINGWETDSPPWPTSPPPWEEAPSFDELRAAVRWANPELLKLALSACGDSMVVEEFPEGRVRYPLGALMVQAPSHSMEHRTHVAAIITSLGLEPPNMDTWAWMEARGAFEETHFEQS